MTKKLINTKNLMCEELLQAVKENVAVVKECGSLEELTDLLMTTTIRSMCHIGQMIEIAEFEYYNPVAVKKEKVAQKCAQLIWEHMMRIKEIKNALEAAANAEQVEEVLNSTSDYYLRAYATEEHYSFEKPIYRLTPYQFLNALRTILNNTKEETQTQEESEMTKNTIKTTEELSSAFEAVKTDVQFSESVTEDTRAIKDLTEMFNLVDKFNNMPRHEHQAVFDAQESLFTKKLYSGKDAEQVFYYTASYLAYLSRLNEYERSEFIRQYNKAKILKIYASALMNKKSVPTTKTGCVKVILEILRQYDACKARKNMA